MTSLFFSQRSKEIAEHGGDWWATVHGVAKSWTRLSDFTFTLWSFKFKSSSMLGRVAAAAAKSLQSCPTLSNPMDCSLPGSSVHGICHARVLEWGAIAFSMGRVKSC